jgi:hypothetical protein
VLSFGVVSVYYFILIFWQHWASTQGLTLARQVLYHLSQLHWFHFVSSCCHLSFTPITLWRKSETVARHLGVWFDITGDTFNMCVPTLGFSNPYSNHVSVTVVEGTPYFVTCNLVPQQDKMKTFSRQIPALLPAFCTPAALLCVVTAVGGKLFGHS